MRALLRLSLLVACAALLPSPARGGTVFDFDTGLPPLVPTMTLPLSQTVGSVTANFFGRFSIQSHDTTFFNLPNFSGNYLVPSDVFSPPLDISFNRLLTTISFDFATADFGLDTNTTLGLTALDNSTPVGSVTSQAVGTGGWGLGFLAFASASPFNSVHIEILPGAGSDFLADNFAVTALSAAVPEPATFVLLGVGLMSAGWWRAKGRR